jgi:hypothetical protein
MSCSLCMGCPCVRPSGYDPPPLSVGVVRPQGVYRPRPVVSIRSGVAYSACAARAECPGWAASRHHHAAPPPADDVRGREGEGVVPHAVSVPLGWLACVGAGDSAGGCRPKKLGGAGPSQQSVVTCTAGCAPPPLHSPRSRRSPSRQTLNGRGIQGERRGRAHTAPQPCRCTI